MDQRASVHGLVAAEPPVTGDPHGTAGALRRLCTAAVKALPACGAGVSLMSDAGVRGVAAASDAASEHVDELEFALGEGPCMDAFTSRRPVLEPDLAAGSTPWPLQGPVVSSCGSGRPKVSSSAMARISKQSQITALPARRVVGTTGPPPSDAAAQRPSVDTHPVGQVIVLDVAGPLSEVVEDWTTRSGSPWHKGRVVWPAT